MGRRVRLAEALVWQSPDYTSGHNRPDPSGRALPAPANTSISSTPPQEEAATEIVGTSFHQPAEAHIVQARLLAVLGIGKPHVAAARQLAERNGTAIEDELMSAGIVCERLYFEALASLLGLRHLEMIDPERVMLSPSIDALLADPRRPLRLDSWGGRTLTVLAPRACDLEHLQAFFERHPQMRETFAIATPTLIRDAVWKARSADRVRQSVRMLFELDPAASARLVVTGWQGALIGTLITFFFASFFLMPGDGLIVMHVFLTSLFLSGIALRFVASFRWRAIGNRPLPSAEDPDLPIYTVAVAMHDEAPVVAQLVKALDAIRWPRTKLDIKLVCEDDDHETINALRRLNLRPEYEIIRVPRVPPFTKPKALTYALTGARGEFIVIYDAEDRMHPDQLLEAYGRFRSEGPRLACIQAPLVIANTGTNWITSLFALEYSGLFRNLLPFLAQVNLPFPLGGTSNHLRTEVLREIGSWDPFNVTEDADLGLRLGRHGYRFDVIARPTLEDAPSRADVWIKQRTRWFKGWLQTWLVMMRRPAAVLRAFGPHGFIVFQIMTAGMLAAALANPLMFYFIATSVASLFMDLTQESHALAGILLGVDAFNLVGTYAAFLWLGYRPMTLKEKLHVGLRWLYLPLYWLMMSAAAWRAVFQLMVKPFVWEKTPHLPVQH